MEFWLYMGSKVIERRTPCAPDDKPLLCYGGAPQSKISLWNVLLVKLDHQGNQCSQTFGISLLAWDMCHHHYVVEAAIEEACLKEDFFYAYFIFLHPLWPSGTGRALRIKNQTTET